MVEDGRIFLHEGVLSLSCRNVKKGDNVDIVGSPTLILLTIFDEAAIYPLETSYDASLVQFSTKIQ